MKPYFESQGITIYNADFRDVFPVIADGSIDMIWTDPPYGHSNLDGDLASSRVGVKGGRQLSPIPIQNDKANDWEPLVRQFLVESKRVLKPDCCCCCTGGGGPDPAFARMALWLDEYLSFFHAIVWDKSSRGNGLGWRYRRNYEFVMVAHRKGGKLSWADDSVAVPNIVRTHPVPNELHPTQKPVPLVAQFIRWHTLSAAIILDPFMGSGTTLRAAKDLGRSAIGIELDERFCETAAQRLSQEVLPLAI